MPIYEYRCDDCACQREFLQKVSDDPIKSCPECGSGKFSKLVSAAGFQLKGSGWYATDFKNASKPASKADAKSKDETKSSDDAKPKEEKKSSDDAKPAAGCAGACACHN
ncbi:MAG: zinc ribbon domain-containing protein [Burkholderiales bacterium]|nr:zinc ribbon domain-containing protein [Burkholderiales bacterium]